MQICYPSKSQPTVFKTHENIGIPNIYGGFIVFNIKLDVAKGAEVGDGDLFLLPISVNRRIQVSGLVLKATVNTKG